MADPLSIAAGVGSLVTVCIKLSHGLHVLAGKYKAAQSVLSTLSVECSVTNTALSQIQQALVLKPDILSHFSVTI